MNVSKFSKYAALTVCTIGISQIVALGSLLPVTIKLIYDSVLRSRYQRLYNEAVANNRDPTEQQALKRQVDYYARRMDDNRNYFAAIGTSLISFSLTAGLGFLEKAFATAVTDIFLGIYNRKKILKQLFPLAGQAKYEPRPKDLKLLKDIDPVKIRKMMLEWPGAKEVSIPVPVREGERFLDGVWIPSKDFLEHSNKAKTALIFHGRASVLEHSFPYAQYLRCKGFNVLLSSYGGYPGSNPQDFQTTEETLLQDGEAVYQYLKTEVGTDYPDEGILCVGVSMGGAIAIDLASKHEKVHLLVDMTFTSPKSVIKNVLINFLPSCCFTKKVVDIIAQNLVSAAFINEEALKNKKKIKAYAGNPLFLHANQDPLMGRVGSGDNLAIRLSNALPISSSRRHSVSIQGGHVAGQIFEKKREEANKKALAELDAFLETIPKVKPDEAPPSPSQSSIQPVDAFKSRPQIDTSHSGDGVQPNAGSPVHSKTSSVVSPNHMLNQTPWIDTSKSGGVPVDPGSPVHSQTSDSQTPSDAFPLRIDTSKSGGVPIDPGSPVHLQTPSNALPFDKESPIEITLSNAWPKHARKSTPQINGFSDAVSPNKGSPNRSNTPSLWALSSVGAGLVVDKSLNH